MRTRWIVLLVSAGLAWSARPAGAQESPRVGLTMGYPVSIGVIWHVGDRVALRPELSFSHASSESASGPSPFSLTSTSETTVVGVAVSALFYVRKWDALRAYVSPRFGYTRSSGSSTTNEVIVGVPELPVNQALSTAASSYLVTGSFGVQYGLGQRFGVFGELGYGYTRSSSSNGGLSAFQLTTNGTGTRTAVGVLFYF